MRKIIQQFDGTTIIKRDGNRRVYLRPGSAEYRKPDTSQRIFRPSPASEERLHRLLMNQRTNWRHFSHYGNLYVIHMECTIAWATFA